MQTLAFSASVIMEIPSDARRLFLSLAPQLTVKIPSRRVIPAVLSVVCIDVYTDCKTVVFRFQFLGDRSKGAST